MASPDLAPYSGEIAAGLVSALVGMGIWWNKQRRDNSKTNLQETQDKISADFMTNIMKDHMRVVEQLKEADTVRAANAERIGGLTSEVNHLRDQITEIKSLVKDMSTKLDKADDEMDDLRKQLNSKDGTIIKITAEKESAIARAKEWEEKYQDLKKGQS